MSAILPLLLAVVFLTLPAGAADTASAFFDDTAVREIRIYFDDSNWYNILFQSHNSNPADPYFPARFQSSGFEIPKIGIRFKGNSSFRRNGIKKPFKIDFNEYDDNATFFGLKKLNLHNGDLQPDMLHEKLFLDYAGKHVAAMRSVHVRLYINDAYYGLYLAVEQPDKTMMQSRYGSDEDGNLYEAGESVLATMAYLGPNASSYTSRYELKTNESANDYSGLIKLLDVLNNTPTASLPAQIEPLLDVENIVAGMALNTLFTNLESYVGTASEYFLYQRSKDGKFVHIHWDTNETFGSTGDGTPRLANPFTMDVFYLPTAAGGGGMPPPGGGGAANNARPLLEKLWAVGAYKRLYLQTLARFLREGFDERTFESRVQELANRIRTHYYEDPNKAFTNVQFETALNNSVNANGFTTNGLTQFVRERAAYLRPVLNGYAQPSDIRLNEIAPGEATPWVELHNLGPGTVSTSGVYLTDDPANPTKWAVPVRSLADGQFLVLFLDGLPAEGDTHANFKLSTAGGSLYLYSSAIGTGTPLDFVQYTAQSSGASYARVGYFGAEWKPTATPTSGAANVVSSGATGPSVSAGTGQLLINEFMADNDNAFADPDEPGAFEDWFEVYNPGASAVNMSGMYITDSLNNATKWRVPEGVTVPARGYLVFIADGATTQGSRHTSWSLSADGESISIYQSDGTTLIDSVTFGPQRTDVALGRTADGSATWSLFAPATPGAANANPLANWIVNGASYQLAPVAPESIASVFGTNLASATAVAGTVPLPTTLSGVTVTVTDSAGVARPAPLYFVSAGQVNFQVPAGTATGRARLALRKQDGTTLPGDLLADPIGPAVFSADATGAGIGLIGALRVDALGNQTPLDTFRYETAQQKIVAAPVSLGAETDKVYLLVYGTGIRGVKAVTSVTATVGGTSVPVTYAAAQGQYEGLDQVNIGPLPRSLAGRGLVNLVVSVDGNRANTVTVAIQ